MSNTSEETNIQLTALFPQLVYKVIQGATQIVFFIVAAHILLPADFGIVALLSVFLTFGNLFVEMGMGSALVQKKECTSDDYASSFWLLMALSTIITIILCGLAGVFARFFSTDRLQEFLQASTVVIVLGALSVVPRAMMQRALRYAAIANIETGAMLFGFIVGVTMLNAGCGVWSIVANTVCTGIIKMVLFFSTTRWLPGRGSLRRLKTFLGFGRDIQVFGLLNFVGKYFDNIIVEKLLGTIQLGYYTFAYRIIQVQQDYVNGTMRQLALPVYSKFQHDHKAVAALFNRDTMVLVTVSLPVLTLLCVTAPWLIPTIFGVAWAVSIPVFQIFTLEAARQTLTILAMQAMMSIGESRFIRNYALLSTPCLLVSFLIGAQWGILGVAVCFFVSNTMFNIYLLLQTRKAFQCSLWQICVQWIPGIILSAVLGVFYSVFNLLFRQWLSAATAYTITALLCIFLFPLILKILSPVSWMLLKRMMFKEQFSYSRRTIIFLDPLVNEGNPHLTLLHQGISREEKNFELHKLKLGSIILRLPFLRCGKFRRKRVILHFHFINRFYESSSLVVSIFLMIRFLFAIVLCRVWGVRIIWTFHDHGAHDYRFRTVEKFFVIFFMQLCDQIITLSHTAIDIIARQYGRSECVHFTPHPHYRQIYCHPISRDKARKQYRIEDNQRLYVYLGRLWYYKGIETLLRTFSRWKPEMATRLMIVGQPKTTQDDLLIKDVVKHDHRITYLNTFLPHAEVEALLTAADFGILPYRKILHSGSAMLYISCGCPVIVPDLGWFPEIFSDHTVGIMYQSQQSDGLFEALENSLQYRREDFQKGIDGLCSEWSLEKAIRITMEVYAQA